MHTYTHIHMRIYGSQMLRPDIFLQLLCTFLFETVALTEYGTHHLDWTEDNRH